MASKPSTYKRLMVQKLTSDFRDAVYVDVANVCRPGKGQVCVRNKFVGINASDVNCTKGLYFSDGKPPFAVGLEAVGEVAEVGEGVSEVQVGQAVAYISQKGISFAEYSCLDASALIPIPEAKREFLPLLISGLTAAIGLDKCARIMAGETVLITAAAGGAGHLAVQWAKAAECHVIGTCSTDAKAELLKDLGCDRVINYKKENMDDVLRKEYPRGVDVVWETVGGEVFQTCLRHLAVKGRLVVVGAITNYRSDGKDAVVDKPDLSMLPASLLFKSASVCGFFLIHFAECFQTYLAFLFESLAKGKLRSLVDDGAAHGRDFAGIEGIVDAVEYLHSGKSIGKVVVRLD